MDLELSDEQRLIVETVRDFVRREIVPREADLDPDSRRAAARGLTSSSSRRSKTWACTARTCPASWAVRESTR